MSLHDSAKGATPSEKPETKSIPFVEDPEPQLQHGRAKTGPRGWSAWFGGPGTTVGPRIGPVMEEISLGIGESDTEDSSNAILNKQIELEDGHAIQYRTCSWQMVCLLHQYSSSPHYRPLGASGRAPQ
jgi:hypothetical protein